MDISIVYDNLYGYIEPRQLPSSILDLLYKKLRYHPDGYEHIFSYKSHRWDGYNYLFDRVNQRFRRGLLNRVVDILSAAGHSVNVVYIGKRSSEHNHKLNSHLIKPYKFQADMVAAASNNDLGLLVSPTGSGKSVTIALLLNELRRNSIILVTDLILLDQMQQVLQRLFDEPIGMVGDGEFDLRSITVSTIQSFASINKAKTIVSAEKRKLLVEHLNTVGAIISDECHLFDTPSMAGIATLFPNADKFFAFSATPYGLTEKTERRENLELEQHFGTIIHDTRKEHDFIHLGLKTPVYVQVINRRPQRWQYNVPMKKCMGKEVPDFTTAYRQCLETEILNCEQYHDDVAAQAKILNASGKSVFIHAAHSIEFGKSIADRIPGATLVNGQTPRLKRREVYDAIRRKDLLCMVSDIGGAGLDIPSLNALILASDLSDIRQLKGRVERACHGKEYGLLVDMHTPVSFLQKHFEVRHSQYRHDNHMIIG